MRAGVAKKHHRAAPELWPQRIDRRQTVWLNLLERITVPPQGGFKA
jgi:hypothetical protein